MLASIGVLEQKDHLQAVLEKAVGGSASVEVRPRHEGGQEFLDVTGDVDPKRERELKVRLAEALGGHILEDLEPFLLERICRRAYGDLSGEERKAVLTLAVRSLREGDMGVRKRLDTIHQKLLEHLRTESVLNLKGFITFRLKEYMEDLEDAVDQAIDDFLIEREYSEFIRLLRYFVEVQSVRISEVHVLVWRDGSFGIFDEDMHHVDGGNLKEFVMDTVDSEVAYEDLLVSALISVAPGRIVVHDAYGRGNPESLATVANVFGERVRFCKGCNLCKRQGQA